MSEEVTYLDFGTKHLHLAQDNVGPGIQIARCGMGPGPRVTDDLPARFKDRPGLFEDEMCERCRRSLLAAVSGSKGERSA